MNNRCVVARVRFVFVAGRALARKTVHSKNSIFVYEPSDSVIFSLSDRILS